MNNPLQQSTKMSNCVICKAKANKHQDPELMFENVFCFLDTHIRTFFMCHSCVAIFFWVNFPNNTLTSYSMNKFLFNHMSLIWWLSHVTYVLPWSKTLRIQTLVVPLENPWSLVIDGHKMQPILKSPCTCKLFWLTWFDWMQYNFNTCVWTNKMSWWWT